LNLEKVQHSKTPRSKYFEIAFLAALRLPYRNSTKLTEGFQFIAEKLNEYTHQAIGKANQFGHRAGDALDASSDYVKNFDLSETESSRVFYDDAKKVKAIVITYSGKLDTAPKPNDVIGEPIEPRPDGGMYKMVRVEDKGFWVSYVRTAGDNPSVMITVQALK